MQTENPDEGAPRFDGGCSLCSRRGFVTGSMLMAVSAVLSACGDGVIGSGLASGGVKGPANLTVKLSAYPALATVGGIVKLSGTTNPIAVVRSTSSTYLAFSMICTHQGTTIDINGNGFRCPNHGAQFNAMGQWIQSPQATSNLQQYAVVLDATAGTLVIT